MVETLDDPGTQDRGRILNAYQQLRPNETATSGPEPESSARQLDPEAIRATIARIPASGEVRDQAEAQEREAGILRRMGTALRDHLDRHADGYKIGAKIGLVATAEALGVPLLPIFGEVAEAGVRLWNDKHRVS
jgi:hypothetical protein